MKQELIADSALGQRHNGSHTFGRLHTAISVVDQATAACPIRAAKGAYIEVCPKCGARANQNCGPEVMALGALETTVRAILEAAVILGVKLPETAAATSVDSQSPSPATPNGLAPNPSGDPL